jgi:DNA-directed RNA polymerase subunit RPC12/RpoP
MAKVIYSCPFCKKQVDEKRVGKTCPNCGMKIRKDEVLFSLETGN